jgi:hypothetical protein
LADADRPKDGTPLAADDVIGSLAARVRELSLRVAELQGELEAARRRIEVFEDFDAQVQDSLSAALRAANQIRERARVSAEAIAAEARAQQPPDAQLLDALRIERDTLRRVLEEASSTPARAAASAPERATAFPMTEMRTAATEALRGVFKELVEEIRASAPPPAQASYTPAPSYAPPPPPQYTPAAPSQYPPPPAPSYTPPVASAPPAARVAPRPEAAPTIEEVEVMPSAPEAAAPPAPAPAPAAEPQPATAETQPAPRAVPEPAREWAAPSEPVGEVQVVLSPISSFPRLVELERRLQGMSAVRTVYARDFRNGVATLAIGLRNPMTVDEFATAVTRLDYPRLRIVSTSGYVLELRIDSEASSIA